MVIPKPFGRKAGRAVLGAPRSQKLHSSPGGAQRTAHPAMRQRGALMVELLVALALLMGVLLPLAYSFSSERRLARAYYNRAVAMEIVDGEMEALVAGQWRAYPPGTHDYKVQSVAATNLPPGRFMLKVEPGKVRLRWQPSGKDRGGHVTREANIR